MAASSSGSADPTQDTDDFDAVVNADGSTTFSGVWETTDPANSSISNFAAALGAATLGSDVPLYWNIHTEEFPGGEIRGQWVCIATDNGETVDGTEGDDILPGLGGDDAVIGRDGNDSIDGGTGDDLTRGIGGDDVVSGGDGDDIVFGGFEQDSMSGDAGDDFLGIIFGENTLSFADDDGFDKVAGYTPGGDTVRPDRGFRPRRFQRPGSDVHLQWRARRLRERLVLPEEHEPELGRGGRFPALTTLGP